MKPHHDFQFDLDTYTRTQELFAAKCKTFDPAAVTSLARDVISRLASEKRHASPASRAISSTTTEPELVVAFCDVLLAYDAAAPLRFLENDLAPVVRARNDLYDYIAAASRLLGVKWDEGEVSYLKVTVATGKLYALVRSVGTARAGVQTGADPQKSAIFASVPGEQHTLGVTVAAEVFRDAGWDIALIVNQTHDALLARAEILQPPVVGLSISNSSRLDALGHLIVALRLTLPKTIIAVAGGPDIDNQTLRDLVDLDIVISDARTAQADLSELLRICASKD